MIGMTLLHDPAVRTSLEARLRSLTPDSRGRWGRMSVDQMLWHLNRAMSVSLGVETAAQERALAPRALIKLAVLRLPWPRNAPTSPGYVPKATYDFEAERAQSLSLIARLVERPVDSRWPDHPLFGSMSGREVSELLAKHLNHHFCQFGV